MMKVITTIVVILFGIIHALPVQHSNLDVSDSEPGQPLFLSQYLPSDADLARKLSFVEGLGNFESYSGFITVNASVGSNMYFWFFPAQNGKQNAPLLMWLQGGPGSSSMYGLFGEIGPFSVSSDGTTLVPRNITWNSDYHLLFVDNPVGAGFSFTLSNSGYVTDEQQVASNLYSFLTQWYEVFSECAPNDFYITGESYAGKYIPSFAYHIHQKNQDSSNPHINLVGIAVGDGAMDPITQFTGFSDFLFFLGLADENERGIILDYESQIVENIAVQNWQAAFDAFDEMLNGDFYPYPTYYYNITGFTEYFNFLQPVYPPNPYTTYLNLNSTRAALHVGSCAYNSYNTTTEYYLIDDWMKSVAPVIPTLLENYKVLFYNGQLDIILGPALAERYYYQIPWSGQSQYRHGPKQLWYVNGAVAGYVRSVKNFRQVVVNAAGHMVPTDQPVWALNMIQRFIENIPFDK